MKVACLHTLESNVEVFDKAAKEANIEVIHVVREDLLKDAEVSGGLTDAIKLRAADALAKAAEQADAVVLTCSTVGPSVVPARSLTDRPVLRVDEALAERAVAMPGKLIVLYAVQTTYEPTRALFEAAGAEKATTEYHLVEGAWDAFKSGDITRYNALVAARADEFFDGGECVVALAQASMSGAVDHCKSGVPLTSPAVSLNTAAEANS